MKIRLEVEVEPTELREFLGLPDVTDLQQDALDAIRTGLHSGAEGLDPVAILRSFVPTGLLSMDEWQGLLRRALESGQAVTRKTVGKGTRRKKPARK
jgi:hypothetical protein